MIELRFDLAKPETGMAASTRAEKAERGSEGRMVGTTEPGSIGVWAEALNSALRFRFLDAGAPSSSPLGGFRPVVW